MNRLIPALMISLGVIGCMSRAISNTPRTAIEQLVLSGAVDRALEKFQLNILKGRKVFVNFEHLDSYDAGYIRGATRARLAKLGSTLVAKPEDAEFTVEVASGGVGTEYKDFLIGLPALPVPSTGLVTPEVPVFKQDERTGIVKLLIFVHKDGHFIASAHYYAKIDHNETIVLWWRFQGKDEVREGWEKADLEVQTAGLRWEPVNE